MPAIVDAVDEAWITFLEQVLGFVAAALKFVFGPDLIKTSRIAAIAPAKILAPYAKPSGDPDIDGVGLSETAGDAIEYARLQQNTALAADIATRLALYEKGEAFHE